METSDVRDLFSQRLGIRLGVQMSEYVLRRLQEGKAAVVPPGPVPVMGGDSRTGIALRRLVPLESLAPLT